MKKYLIVADSTSALDIETAQKHGIVLVPLSVVIDGKQYKDHYEIGYEQLYDELRAGKVATTSQPSVGYIEDLMEQWKKENYDAIIVICCSSGLSGTYQSFHIAKEHMQMDNVHLIDSRSVGAPLYDMAIVAKQMADAGEEEVKILEKIVSKCENTFSFLYPESLDQLKKGGRISPVAAGMASLLKIKPLLYLANNGAVVDKFMMGRTENKIFQAAINQFLDDHVSVQTHKLYIMHADNMEAALRFVAFAQDKLGPIEYEILNLPAVLTCHGGMGCIAMQTTLK